MKQIKFIVVLIIALNLIVSAHSTLANEGQLDQQKAKPSTVLITGANRGLGLALATRFLKDGFDVIGTARKPGEAIALKALGVRVEQLDITDSASVQALATRLNGQAISILINNAGIGGQWSGRFTDLEVDKLMRFFDVNSIGALRVTQALLPNLQAGKDKKIVSISSRMGSIGQNSGTAALGYRASKAALNSFNKSLSNEFSAQGYIFVVMHPGWVRTDMTSEAATYSSQQSAEKLFNVITGLSGSDAGTFLDLHGEVIGW